MFDTVLLIAMFLLTLSIGVCLYRVIKGPSTADRVLALDTISYSIIGIVAILTIMLDSTAYLDVILLLGILSFVGTVALCKFLEDGVVIQHDRSD